MLVDVGSKGLTGKDCQIALDEAGITVNKNTIPFETRSPFQASGIRVGTPAVTTRGMKEPEMAAIADMISEVLMDIKNVDAAHKVRQRVRGRFGSVRTAADNPTKRTLRSFSTRFAPFDRLSLLPNLSYAQSRRSQKTQPATQRTRAGNPRGRHAAGDWPNASRTSRSWNECSG
jgi:hypothetical protein